MPVELWQERRLWRRPSCPAGLAHRSAPPSVDSGPRASPCLGPWRRPLYLSQGRASRDAAPTSDRSTPLCCLRQTPRARRPSRGLGSWLRPAKKQRPSEGRTQQHTARITGNNQSPRPRAGSCRSPSCGRQGRRSHGRVACADGTRRNHEGIACADGVASPARRAPTTARAGTTVERVERSHAPEAPKDAAVPGYGASRPGMACARLSEAGRRSQPMRHIPALPRLPPKPIQPDAFAPTVAVAVAVAIAVGIEGEAVAMSLRDRRTQRKTRAASRRRAFRISRPVRCANARTQPRSAAGAAVTAAAPAPPRPWPWAGGPAW